jgi:ubiquinone/menaquinone biosynthesis C-methylase UbiE
MNLKTHLQLVDSYYNKIKKIFFLTTSKKYLIEAFKFTSNTTDHFKKIAQLSEITDSCLKILDCGCGFGEPQNILNSLFASNGFYGITINEYQVKNKRHNNVFLGNYDNLPFENDHFDRVLFLESMQHSYKLKATLKEAYRVLKPGGILFVLDGFMDDNEFKLLVKKNIVRYNYRKYRDFFGSYRFSMRVLIESAKKIGFKLEKYEEKCNNFEQLKTNSYSEKIANFLYFGDTVNTPILDYGYAVFVKE